MNWLLIILINGQGVPTSCEQSLCFERYEDCFRFEIRILNESLSNKITATCIKLGENNDSE